MSTSYHRGQPGYPIMHQRSDTFVGLWPVPWWVGQGGAIRIILILVLLVLLFHGYPFPGAPA